MDKRLLLVFFTVLIAILTGMGCLQMKNSPALPTPEAMQISVQTGQFPAQTSPAMGRTHDQEPALPITIPTVDITIPTIPDMESYSVLDILG
jgi:hypothetical protein